MENFIKNLKRLYWVSAGGDITFSFDKVKGIHVVTVREYHNCRSKECSFTLIPTGSNKVAQFNTHNGTVTIAITDNGEELYVSPHGIFLIDYNVAQKKKNEDAKGFVTVEEEPKMVIL